MFPRVLHGAGLDYRSMQQCSGVQFPFSRAKISCVTFLCHHNSDLWSWTIWSCKLQRKSSKSQSSIFFKIPQSLHLLPRLVPWSLTHPETLRFMTETSETVGLVSLNGSKRDQWVRQRHGKSAKTLPASTWFKTNSKQIKFSHSWNMLNLCQICQVVWWSWTQASSSTRPQTMAKCQRRPASMENMEAALSVVIWLNFMLW